MKLKKQIILFCLIMVIEIPFNNLFCQTVTLKPSRQSSFEAFSKGDYEKAYAEFRELLKTYSKDPLYKYYSGVCLVKLNRDPGEATNLLQQAIQGAGNVKTLPSDGLFYLGRAQQMSGKFPEASESYNLFTNEVGKKAAKELGVPEFLQQCAQKKGQVADSEIKPVATEKNVKVDTIKPEARPAVKEAVHKTVENTNSPKVNLPANYDKILDEAVNLQYKADSVNAIVNNQKKEIEKLSGNEKFALRIKITENEKLASSLQSSADKKYREAQAAMNPQRDSTLHPKETAVKTEYVTVKDSSAKAGDKNLKAVEKQADAAKTVIPAIKTKEEVFAVFEVLTKPASDQKEKIIIDPEVPPGLIYRIQIAVFRNPVAPSYFKGITPVCGFKIAGTDKTSYYAGMFRKSADAAKALTAVKARGFKDAFVVAQSANKPVSADRAAMMEKEWGSKPLFVKEVSSQGAQADTIPPALLFRVEVTRSQKPLKDDIVEGIRKMAGNRGLDIKPLDDGKIAYIIGKFITFETAAEYADLLNRNGYREAQVVAWLGKKEISIETARQLFENLK
jgi:hypothetical protein